MRSSRVRIDGLDLPMSGETCISRRARETSSTPPLHRGAATTGRGAERIARSWRAPRDDAAFLVAYRPAGPLGSTRSRRGTSWACARLERLAPSDSAETRAGACGLSRSRPAVAIDPQVERRGIHEPRPAEIEVGVAQDDVGLHRSSKPSPSCLQYVPGGPRDVICPSSPACALGCSMRHASATFCAGSSGH